MFAKIAGVILIGALTAAGAHAQERLATLTGVQGTVLVGKGESMTAGFTGQALPSGARVVVTNKSQAGIVYDSGCQVALGENSRTTVHSDASCTRLQSEVVKLAQAPGAIGGTAGAAKGASVGASAFAIGGFAASAGAIGYGGYQSMKRDRNASDTSPSR